MTKVLSAIKAVLLAGALLVVGWSATKTLDLAYADTCKDSGHTCHAEIDGKIYHLKKVQDY